MLLYNLVLRSSLILGIFAAVTFCNINTTQGINGKEDRSSQTETILATDTLVSAQKKASDKPVLHLAPLTKQDQVMVDKVVDTITHSKIETIKAVLRAIKQKSNNITTKLAENPKVQMFLAVFNYIFIYPTKLALKVLRLLWDYSPSIVKSLVMTTISLLIVFTLWKLGYFSVIFCGTHKVLHIFNRVMAWLGLSTMAKGSKLLDQGLTVTEKTVNTLGKTAEIVAPAVIKTANVIESLQPKIDAISNIISSTTINIQKILSPAIPVVIPPAPTPSYSSWTQTWEWLKYLWNNGAVVS